VPAPKSTMEWAEFYAAELGWRLAPFKIQRPPGGRKKVSGQVAGWQNKATTDVATLHKWFAQPGWHIGLLLGPHSGVIDVEADAAQGKALLARRMERTRTPHYLSTNSPHYLFRWIPEFEPTHAVKIDVDGLECRIGRKDMDGAPVGCQSLLPPTDNRRWVIDPNDCPLADPPEWLVELIVGKFRTRRPPHVSPRPMGVTDLEIRQSAKAYALAATPAVEGHDGDRQTWLVTLVIVNGYDLSDDEALRVMSIYNERCLPPWTDKQLRHKIQCARQLHMDRGFRLELEFGGGILLERSPTSGIVDLTSYRCSMQRDLGRHTVAVDHSPTGLGKSYADGLAIKSRNCASLTVLPTHVNGRELAQTYGQDHGLDAVCFPEITDQNCQRFAEVEQARDHGFSAPQVLCLDCIYADVGECKYQHQADAALQAEHLICTHKRLELTASDVTKNRGYVAVHENSTDTLLPMTVLSDKQLEKTRKLLAKMVDRFEERVADRVFTRLLINAVKYLRRRLVDTDETCVLEETFPVQSGKPPRYFLRNVWNRRRGRERLDRECLVAIISLVTGDFLRWAVSVSEFKRNLEKQIVVVCRTHLPSRRTWVLADATGSLQIVNAALAGDRRIPQDITPSGRPLQKKRIVQFVSNDEPAGLTRSKSTKTAAEYLTTVTRRISNRYGRLGVIGHSNHIKEIFEDRSVELPGDVCRRIVKTCYFGEGPDRASNDWTEQCDALVILGTPRVRESVIRHDLIRIGDSAAAKIAPRWALAKWYGTAADGLPLIVETRAYDHQSWRDAYRRIVTAALVQALGRARVYLDTGIDVVVASNDLLDGFEVEIREHARPNGLLEQVLELIRHANHGLSVTELALKVGRSVRQVRRLLLNAQPREPCLFQQGKVWIWAESDADKLDRVESFKAAAKRQPEGLTTREVAELWGTSARHARRLLKDMAGASRVSGRRWIWSE